MSLVKSKNDIQKQHNEQKENMLTDASNMEDSRSRLQSAILNNADACKVLSHLFFSQQADETDISDIINTKYVSDAVQNHDFVQLTAKQSAQQLADSLTVSTPTNLDLLHNQHFLPGFLLQVADLVAVSPSINKQYKEKIRKQARSLFSHRQKLIMDNSKLVAFIARKYSSGNIPFSDVLQEGTLGLIKAVDRYDHRRDIKFSTYASYWIRQTVSRLVVRQEKIVRLPFGLAERASTVFDIMRTTYLTENRWPTNREIKARCDLSEREISLIVTYYQATQTTSTVDNKENESLDIMEKLEQHQFQQPLDTLAESNLNSYLSKAVESLPKKEADILTLRFGLKNHQEMTLQAVAEQMNVTRERIRQIQNQALGKLKSHFGYELSYYLDK